MRQYLGLVIGLVVGVVGAILFQQSMPPEEGSTEEKVEKLQGELRVTRMKLSRYEANYGPGSKRTVRDGMRSIAEDMREGRDVSLDDVFSTMKPWMRDMAPLFDRMRMVEQEERFDSLAGHYAREYHLSDEGQAELKEWFREREEENARAFHDMINSDTTGFVDFVRVMEMNEDSERGLDTFMETWLESEELAAFKVERLQGRVDSVQDEANRRLHRLDEVVDLDENQLDGMFAVMARGSRRYEPGMEFDGMGADTGRLEGRARDGAIRRVLRPDQLDRYIEYQAERRLEAEREMGRIGMKLPRDWDLLDDAGF
ncbi:MAG: hypothetical protein VCA40_11520 [Roseibacillus sp.]